MAKGLLPAKRGNHGIRPQRTKLSTSRYYTSRKAAAIANASGHDRWDTAAADCIRPIPCLGSGGIRRSPLDAGGFGMLGLWEKLDGSGSKIKVKKAYSI